MYGFQFLIPAQFLNHFSCSIRAFICCLILVFLSCIHTDAWASDHYDIVVYTGVGEKEISINSLRSIFSMRQKTWPDGTKIRVFVLPDDDELHQNVSKEILNVFPYQLRSMWDRLVFSGTGQAPIKVNSVDEMLAKVASTPGAIGYLWRAKINDTVNVLQIK